MRMPALPTLLRWLLVGVWAVSTLSQLHAGWRDWRTRDPFAHPEMPAEGQERALAVLRECTRRVAPGDLLVVAGGDDAIEVFLRYRLAYLLYPVRVVDAPREPDALREALGQPGRFGARYALVLGQPEIDIASAQALDLTPLDRLFQAERGE